MFSIYFVIVHCLPNYGMIFVTLLLFALNHIFIFAVIIHLQKKIKISLLAKWHILLCICIICMLCIFENEVKQYIRTIRDSTKNKAFKTLDLFVILVYSCNMIL